MDLDIRLVRYFVTVADELHFGRAAERLYISQPALSKQIRRLENDVGTPLLVRDSRHVALTPRGDRFLEDARQLLLIAERMLRTPMADTVRIAHIFELDTSRQIADAFTRSFPDLQLVERNMDSVRQLDALLSGQLDVGILRLTPAMLARQPSGWQRRLIRLEPMLLVGRPGDPAPDPARGTASFHDRRIEVFADPAGSGLFNVHGEYLADLEQQTRIPLHWLGNPGTFQHCLAALERARGPAFTLEFESYARRYAEAGIPVHRPAELQPVYPWWIAWRETASADATAAFVRMALETSERQGWLHPRNPDQAPLWLPADDPALHERSPRGHQ